MYVLYEILGKSRGYFKLCCGQTKVRMRSARGSYLLISEFCSIWEKEPENLLGSDLSRLEIICFNFSPINLVNFGESFILKIEGSVKSRFVKFYLHYVGVNKITSRNILWLKIDVGTFYERLGK